MQKPGSPGRWKHSRSSWGRSNAHQSPPSTSAHSPAAPKQHTQTQTPGRGPPGGGGWGGGRPRGGATRREQRRQRSRWRVWTRARAWEGATLCVHPLGVSGEAADPHAVGQATPSERGTGERSRGPTRAEPPEPGGRGVRRSRRRESPYPTGPALGGEREGGGLPAQEQHVRPRGGAE